MRINPAIIALALLLAAVVAPAAAQAITVSTDKSSYMPGETLVVSGQAPPNAPVGIAIRNPAGIPVAFTMVNADSGGKYSATFKLPPTLPYEDWVAGTYTVEAKVGTATATAKFTLALAALITGSVVDEEGKPVANAEVLVVELGTSTQTGSDGKFTVGADVGTFTLKVSKAGYLSTKLAVTTKTGVNDVGTIQLKSLEKVLSELSAEISSLNTAVSDLKGRVSALETQIPTQLSEISGKLDDLKTALNSVSKALSDLSSKLDDLKSLSADLSKAISDQSGKISGLSDKVASIEKSVSDLSKSVSALEGKVTDALGKVSSAVDALRVDITGLRSDLKSVSDAQKDLSSKVDGLSGKLDSAQAALSGKVDGLSGAVYAAVVLALLAFIAALMSYMTVRKAIAK